MRSIGFALAPDRVYHAFTVAGKEKMWHFLAEKPHLTFHLLFRVAKQP